MNHPKLNNKSFYYMIILGIESSCDDTSVALIEANSLSTLNPPSGSGGNFVILAKKTASQIEVHKKYGGVVPEIAGRMHAENIMPLIECVLEEALEHIPHNTYHISNDSSKKKKNRSINKQIIPDVIAVTSGPGLITGLLVGVEAAKTLSYLWDVPLVSVNHIDGHAHSVEIRNPKLEIRNRLEFPALCLIVSGGHTELLLMEGHDKYKLLGKTRDDAVGETFDKVAKLIGFDYPGGAKISQTAEGGNTKAINFPRPMINEGYEFSFAGLKTSALYWLRDNATKNTPTSYKLQAKKLNDFCASFEQAIIDVLTAKTIRAVKEFKPKTIIIGGGVSANKKLRNELDKQLKTIGSELLAPNLQYSMDNAAMIAVAGYYKAIKKDFISWKDIQADPNWEVYE